MTTIKIGNFEEVRTITVDMKPGIGIHLLGQRDETVQNTLLRVITALQSAGARIPGKKIVITITGQTIKGQPKEVDGHEESHDLPIAIGLLAESGQLSDNFSLGEFVASGELTLDGYIRGTSHNIKELVK